MKQEDKELLLKDLCARLPYGVKVCARVNSGNRYVAKILGFRLKDVFELKENDLHTATLSAIDDIKPFLRPMSSMTDEEKMFVNGLIYNKDGIWISPIPTWVINESDVEKYIDFCHKHHLDWRGLIEKGLAIGTINGIYN